jgi:hypothetical protein
MLVNYFRGGVSIPTAAIPVAIIPTALVLNF